LDDSVQSWLTDTAEKILTSLGEYELFHIKEVDEGGESIKLLLDLSEVESLQEWITYIQEAEVASAHNIINREDFKPRMFLCQLTIGEETLYLLRAVSDSIFIKPKKVKLIKFAPGRGCYELEEETNNKTIQLDENWDSILIGDKVVILNERKTLENFKYYDKLREAAQETLQQISGTDLLADMEAFSEFVEGRILLMKKLAKFGQAFEFDENKKNRIKALINEGTIKLHLNEEGKIICSTPEEFRAVMDIYLDNYMESVVSDKRYKALNKTEWKT
jgi:hypothetical protein